VVALTLNPIDIEAVIAKLITPASGGVNVFIGTTRNHSHGREVTLLEYEAFEPMAIELMADLERRAREQWPLHGVVLVHRLGKVSIGEASVVVGVSASHRKEAFEACRFLIDSLKKEVPVWKREHFADGTVEWSGENQKSKVKKQKQSKSEIEN
jgi:molybdopterin synthase catalytic subunit